MICLDKLPREIIGCICSFLEDSGLAALAVTATVFRYEAERHLYRDVSWVGGRKESGYRFRPLLRPGDSRALFVRSMEIEFNGSPIEDLRLALPRCALLKHLRLYCSGSIPIDGPRTLPRTLESLDISWSIFAPEELFRLLGTTPRLDSLTVHDWPMELKEDKLPPGALPALRFLTGSVALVLALLPARPTVTSVSILGDYVAQPLIDAISRNDLRHLEVMFEDSTIDRICSACPNLRSVFFRDAITEDLQAWLDGRFPDGWSNLTSMRFLYVEFDMISHEVIERGSAALLRARLQDIWPRLDRVFFYRSLRSGCIDWA
ncbi:hypothetical protein AURDEDRAFT_113513 [Auricularia subglabra TFB-10046 SS5]|nr:hypothetical protein AURDEDRAFT_113513 [Auricularia subglabra TFB-10046 SS5]